MGVAPGCGCKEVYRFPHTTYPTPLVSVLFAAASLLFVIIIIIMGMKHEFAE